MEELKSLIYNPSLFPQHQDACSCLLKCRIRQSPITLKIHISNSVRFLFLFFLFLILTRSNYLKILNPTQSDYPFFLIFKKDDSSFQIYFWCPMSKRNSWWVSTLQKQDTFFPSFSRKSYTICGTTRPRGVL